MLVVPVCCGHWLVKIDIRGQLRRWFVESPRLLMRWVKLVRWDNTLRKKYRNWGSNNILKYINNINSITLQSFNAFIIFYLGLLQYDGLVCGTLPEGHRLQSWFFCTFLWWLDLLIFDGQSYKYFWKNVTKYTRRCISLFYVRCWRFQISSSWIKHINYACYTTETKR